MAKYQLIDDTVGINTLTVAVIKKEDIPANTRCTFPVNDEAPYAAPPAAKAPKAIDASGLSSTQFALQSVH